jgi:hypothetical protein
MMTKESKHRDKSAETNEAQAAEQALSFKQLS